MLSPHPHAFRAETADAALPDLLRLLQNQTPRDSRNGKTYEVTGLTLEIENPHRKYITTPGRNASLPAQIVETMWVLRGLNTIETISPYLPRAKDFSDDGVTWRGGYGPRLRGSALGSVDQLEHVVSLLRADPDTRRAAINIYDSTRDSSPGKDIPCNDFLIFRATEQRELNLYVTTRSNDVIWGWSGINSFEWATLLQVVAAMTGMAVGTVTYSVASFHLYEHHYKKASRIIEQASAVPTEYVVQGFLQGLNTGTTLRVLDDIIDHWFSAEEAIRNGVSWKELALYFDAIPVAEWKMWLRILWGWWNENEQVYPGTRSDVGVAARNSPRCLRPIVRPEEQPPAADGVGEASPFVEFVDELHRAKHAAYGDSWKRRGETLGILANIARKVDRLGVTDKNETSADTAIDLLVYALKYRLWLSDFSGAPHGPLPQDGLLTDDPHFVTVLLKHYLTKAEADDSAAEGDTASYEATLIKRIRYLFDNKISEEGPRKGRTQYVYVDRLIRATYPLALRLWKKEQWQEGNRTRRFEGYNV